MSLTLDGMTTAQLSDLIARAQRTIAQQQAAEHEKARKAAKDIIPPPGTFWRYNKRVWTAQLSDLIARAQRTMAQQQAAEQEKARKAAKDIIPPPGTFWRYNKRVWTVIGFPKEDTNCLVSVDENGNDVRYWFMSKGEQRFSTHKGISHGEDLERWNAGGHPLSALKTKVFRENKVFWEGIGRLILTVRDIK